MAMKTKALLLAYLAVSMVSCSMRSEDKILKALMLTGNDHPAHKWEETSPVIKEIMESDSTIVVTITRNPERLAALDKETFDFLILNYCNWEDPEGLSEAAKNGLIRYLDQGGGLMVLHFANGAFHFSLPKAESSDWPEYRKIVHQVWDHTGESTHDDYGEFEVHIKDSDHYITGGISNFITEDELYFNQVGEEDLEPLYTAVSKKSLKKEPLAWAYTYKNARVFQSLLGHGAISYQPHEYREILMNAAFWVCREER